MPSIVVIKSKLENSTEWFSENMQCDSNWSFDEQLNEYHIGPIYMKQSDNITSFEDMSEEVFFGCQISAWIALADNKELIYGYYNDSGSAEFVHIKDGMCIRDYRMYDFKLDTDQGDTPEFEDWADVCDLIDDNLL